MPISRELSQLASVLTVKDSDKFVGIGSTQPTAKLDVGGAVVAVAFTGDGSGLTGVSTFSGSYNDLTNTPTIPSDTGDLTNNAGFVTSGIVVGYATETFVNNLVAISTFSGSYNDLTNTPTIPTNNNELTNGAGYITGYTVTQSDVTTHQAALSITESQISDLQTYATQTYVNTEVANLVDSSPDALNTLNELAAALGDDANFSTTVTNSLANKANLTGATFTGIVTATSFSGDGSNLSNIISGVGINSNGVIVGTGITTLNFLGSGTTVSISGNTADISVSSSSVETSPGKSSSSFTATGGQTSFSVSYSVGYIDVYLNGIRLSSDEFTASNGSSVILNTGASSGDVLDIVQYTMGKGDTGDPGPSGPLEVETTSNNDTYNPVFALGTGTTTAFTNSNLSFNPSSGILSATTYYGDGSQLTGISAGSTVADDTSTNETFYPIFTQTTSGTILASKVSTTKLSFNPSTGNLSATDFNSTSDINLKENIQRIDNPIEKVLQINGVTFDWKESHQSSAGIIAQEVEAILPEIIKENQGNKSVNYNGLIGLLVEVVKNQQDQINNLTNRVNIIEEGNN